MVALAERALRHKARQGTLRPLLLKLPVDCEDAWATSNNQLKINFNGPFDSKLWELTSISKQFFKP